MKKRITMLLALLLASCLLSGCCLIHSWQNATCETPKTCIECGKTDGKAIGHQWQDATCEEPKFCDACGATEGRALGHNWAEGTETTPRTCWRCAFMEPMATPSSGEVFIGKGTYCGSMLTIRSSTTQSCYIKLKDASGKDVYSFFVPAGETVIAPVPSGHYYVYFAYGTDWYGPEYIFGPGTTYAKDDEICDFVSYTWEYTLYPSSGGNFSETPISENEF